MGMYDEIYTLINLKILNNRINKKISNAFFFVFLRILHNSV